MTSHIWWCFEEPAGAGAAADEAICDEVWCFTKVVLVAADSAGLMEGAWRALCPLTATGESRESICERRRVVNVGSSCLKDAAKEYCESV